MSASIALCLDEMSCRNPEIIGLGGEAFDSQRWLQVHTTGAEARQALQGASSPNEAWVLSCNDIEPINLAATLKADTPALHVCLVTTDPCGSLFSRAHTAGIDEVLELKAFLGRYAEAKRRLLGELFVEGTSSQPPQVQAEAIPAPDVPMVVSSEMPMQEPILIAQPNVPVADNAPQLVPTIPSPDPSPLTAQYLQPRRETGLAVVGTASRAFVVTVVSGSGGAGKSAVSALGALVSQKQGHRTLLLDCDLQFGDVAAMVGAENPLSVDDAIMHPDRLERELAPGKPLVVLSAPAHLEIAEQVVPHLAAFMDRLIHEFEVIVVNTGASWGEQHAVLLERSSAALFLIDQRVSSIRACQHAIDLCSRCGIATGPFRFVLNRCAKGAPLTSADVSCVLKDAAIYELKDGGRDVEDYLSAGAAHDLLRARNEFARSLEHVMAQVLPGNPQAAADAHGGNERRQARKLGRRAGRKRGW